MRVCLVSAEYAPQVGGLADYTRLLARHLAAAGAEVVVLTGAGCAGQPGDPFEVAAEVPGWGFGLLRTLRLAVDRLRPQVLHVQFQTAAYGMRAGIMLAPAWVRVRRPAVTCVTTFHDLRLPYLFPKAHLLRRLLLRLMATESAVAIATNDDDRLALGALGARSTRIPIGSNVARSPLPAYTRAELAGRWGVPADGALLGYFGLLNQAKGFETLLRALALLAEGGRRVHLLALGERAGASDPTNRTYAERIDALARQLGVDGCITWTGYLPEDDLSRTLRAADVCVLPFAEGASLRSGTLLAALANGAPLVTTAPAEGAAPLADGEHALLVPPGDPHALARACGRLLADPALRARLSNGGGAFARDFSWDAIAQAHLELYQRLTSAPGGGER